MYPMTVCMCSRCSEEEEGEAFCYTAVHLTEIQLLSSASVPDVCMLPDLTPSTAAKSVGYSQPFGRLHNFCNSFFSHLNFSSPSYSPPFNLPPFCHSLLKYYFLFLFSIPFPHLTSFFLLLCTLLNLSSLIPSLFLSLFVSYLSLLILCRRIKALLPESQKWWEDEDGGNKRTTRALSQFKLQELEKEQKVCLEILHLTTSMTRRV